MNGTEICDGEDMPYICLKVTASKVEIGKTCTKGQVGTQGSCETGFVCRLPAICNGGADNGTPCGSSFKACATGGSCVSAVCSNDCGGSCPLAYKTTSLLVKSQLEGSQPTAGIELYSYLNKGKATPDNAILSIPACRAGVSITASVDSTKSDPLPVDVVFLTDLSWELPKGEPLTTISETISDAINSLFDISDNVQIAMVSFGFDNQNTIQVDSELVNSSKQQTLKAKASTYLSTGGFPTATYQGLQKAIELLDKQPNDHTKVVILLSDWGVNIKKDGGWCGNTAVELSTCTKVARTELIDAHPEIRFYSAAVSAKADKIAYVGHLSSTTCKNINMASLTDCDNSNGQYAFHGTTASELKGMYSAMVDSILLPITTLTATNANGAQSIPTSTPAGNSVTLDLPDSFKCQDTSQFIPIRTSFLGKGVMSFSNFNFSYCPLN